MAETLVSVIVATRRRDTELVRALESLVTQTYCPFEVLVIDDNDDWEWNRKTEATIEAFQSQLNLRYIQNHPEKGSAEARNIGIHAARGEYITFLDDDDVYLPEKIARQLEQMQEQNADYSLTDLDLYFDDGRLSEHRRRDYIRPNVSLLECHFKHHMTGTDTLMFRRKYLLAIGGFPGIDLGDEFYLMHRAIDGGGKLAYLNRCDVCAYVHDGDSGLSSGETKIRCENDLYAYKKQFFYLFDRRVIRHIRMRHHAVLAFAALRMRRPCVAVAHAFQSVVSAPFQCMYMVIQRKL